MRRRRVTTSFIISQSSTPSNAFPERVLLLRRSDKVNTYQGHWAGISGSVEDSDPDPMFRATREVEEETRLVLGRDVEFVRAGKKIVVDGGPRHPDMVFEVFPFLFRLINPNTPVTIDWEHSEYKWIPPTEMLSYTTVPQLPETLSRVFIARAAHDGIRELKEDRSLGARQMSHRSLSILLSCPSDPSFYIFRQYAPLTPRGLYLTLLNCAYHIAAARPSMSASIRGAMARVMGDTKIEVEAAEKELEQDQDRDATSNAGAVKRVLTKFAEAAKRVQSDIETAQERVNTNAVKVLLGNRGGTGDKKGRSDSLRLLTISSSSTVLGIVEHLVRTISEDNSTAGVAQLSTNGLPSALHVHVLESRPLCEGATSFAPQLEALISQQRRPLSAPPIHLHIHTDAAALSVLLSNSIDFVLLGADRVDHSSADAVNKTGSAVLAGCALLARQLAAAMDRKEESQSNAVKVMVVADTSKVGEAVAEVDGGVMERQSADEMFGAYGGKHLAPTRKLVPAVTVDYDNVYFERIPAAWIDVHVTEECAFWRETMANSETETSKAMVVRVWEQRKEVDTVFDDL
ncbi:hypothetical protein HDU93_001981 [Gonapodya sp. JEL0774]|nr:hypothetical protein HDU93_001981 [Gonapodya sp. JEL0774]